jgi:hypothetical protein
MNEDAYIRKIRTAMAKPLKHLIEAGNCLDEAKCNLSEREFYRLLSDMQISYGFARMLRRFAKHPVISNPQHAWRLPPDREVLHHLAKLSKRNLDHALNEDRVSFDLTEKEAITLVKQYGGRIL